MQVRNRVRVRVRLGLVLLLQYICGGLQYGKFHLYRVDLVDTVMAASPAQPEIVSGNTRH